MASLSDSGGAEGSGSSQIAAALGVIAASTPSAPPLSSVLADIRKFSASATPTVGLVQTQIASALGKASGSEFLYGQITSPVSVIGTTSGTATSVISLGGAVFPGAVVMVAEFFCGLIGMPAVAGGTMSFGLYDGSTLVAIMAQLQNPAAAANWQAGTYRYRFIPSAGSHSYGIKSWVSSVTGGPNVSAGSGAATTTPAYLRFTRA